MGEKTRRGLRERACECFLSLSLFPSPPSHLLELARRQDGGQGGLARILEADQGKLQLLVEKEAGKMREGENVMAGGGGLVRARTGAGGRAGGMMRDGRAGWAARTRSRPGVSPSTTTTRQLTCAASPAATGTRRSCWGGRREGGGGGWANGRPARARGRGRRGGSRASSQSARV